MRKNITTRVRRNKMAIPKIIHYCWFGQKEMSDLDKECIESWKKYLPDYEFRFWNEDNFDVTQSNYVREAYEQNHFVFVSDYLRWYALSNFGGMYLDLDIEVLKNLDEFLENNHTFLGFENKTLIGTGIVGTEKGSWISKKMFEYYDTHDFVNEDGNIDTTASVQIIVPILEERGFVRENKEQFLGDIHIYERDIFFPKKLDEDHFRTTDRTVTIHKFEGTWLTDREKKRGTSKVWRNVCRPVLRKIRSVITKLMGRKRAKRIEASLRDKIR